MRKAARMLPNSRGFLLGVNYWSRAGGPRMWEPNHYDPQRITAELQQMRGIGLDVCRAFSFIPTFMPEPGKVDQAACDRFAHFLSLCEDSGLAAIPSFLVGHMSGENYDFPGQRERDLYSDPELIRWQQRLVSAIGKVGAASPAVIAYLASNEMPLWGGISEPALIEHWVQVLRRSLSAEDPNRPFGVGDGVMNLKGGQNGFHVPTLAPHVDFFGPHTYRPNSDPLRQALNAEYCLRSVSYTDRPFIFEEFGASATQASEQNQALYYREVIHSSLCSGAAGALGWCYSDFDLADAPPYRHHAFELGFGITRADGGEKPACDELRAFRRLLDQLDQPTLQRPTIRAAIVVPSYFNQSYPFSWEDRDRIQRVLLQAYALCAKAGIEVELLPETHDYSKYQLLLLPATQKLLTKSWTRLVQAADGGATVYWSYFSGDYAFHQGAWCHIFERLTGTTHQLRYGCIDLPPQALEITGVFRLCLQTLDGFSPYPRAFLPVVAHGATEVLAHAMDGQPALTRQGIGQGSVYFCPYPLEYYLAEQANINESDCTHQIYELLAENAGLKGHFTSDDPLVQLRQLSDRHSSLLWVFNRSWQQREVSLGTSEAHAIHGTAEPLAAGTSRVVLDPKEIRVYRCR